jgi:hypothetical protein
MSATLSVKGANPAKKAEVILHYKHTLLAQKMLPHLNADQQRSLVEAIVQEDSALLHKYFTREFGTESLREAMEQKIAPLAPVAVVEEVRETVPEQTAHRTEVWHDDQSAAGKGSIHVEVNLVEDQDGGSEVEGMTYHSWPDSPFLDADDEDQLFEYLCDEAAFELVDPSEASLMDFEREEGADVENLPLTDEELDSIAATFALQEIERLKFAFISPMINNMFVGRLQAIEQRIDREAAFRLVTILRERAGSRFVEETDSDIQF